MKLVISWAVCATAKTISAAPRCATLSCCRPPVVPIIVEYFTKLFYPFKNQFGLKICEVTCSLCRSIRIQFLYDQIFSSNFYSFILQSIYRSTTWSIISFVQVYHLYLSSFVLEQLSFVVFSPFILY